MVEVKELVLRANFTERPLGAAANGQGTNTNGNCGDIAGDLGGVGANNTGGSGNNNDVVEDCVRQVLAILKRQKER